MIDREAVTDITTLKEAKDEFSPGDSRGNQTVAEARSGEHWSGSVGGVETVAGLGVGDTGAEHGFGSCS